MPVRLESYPLSGLAGLTFLDRLGKLNALYLHDYDQAIRYYKQLVMLYPRSSQAFAGLATIADILQHKLGKHEAAIEAYRPENWATDVRAWDWRTRYERDGRADKFPMTRQWLKRVRGDAPINVVD